MAIFKSLLAAAIALIGTAHAVPQLESRQMKSPLDWSYIGCWSDDPVHRTLTAASFTDATGLTVESCRTACGNDNFNLAGVEFAKECYCGNALDNGPTIIPSTSCNQACIGNGLENCGGPRAIGIYRQVI